MKYPKINTLWKRDANNKCTIIEGEYSCPEFDNIKRWHITEKIDGTNIRIMFMEEGLEFGGRTDDAEIPGALLLKLKELFTERKMANQFPGAQKVILYGEGYGNTIQNSGRYYRDDCSFILFDVWIDGWWLEQQNVEDIALKLGIEHAPCLGITSIEEAVKGLKEKKKSMLSDKLTAEGIVARSHPLLLFRDGTPIMWKLKIRDYTKLEKTKVSLL